MNYRFGLLMIVVILAGASCQSSLADNQVCRGDTCITIERATTAGEWQRGLGGRTSLATDQGMLFLFPTTAERSFWMKDVSFGLDILFLDDAKTIVSIAADQSPCTGQTTCPLIPSGQPCRYVLEIPAGRAATLGLAVGDQLEWK